LGKSWILERIRWENLTDRTRRVHTRDLKRTIDFSDTRAHNLRGLQHLISEQLNTPDVFTVYWDFLNQLDLRRQEKNVHPNMLANLEARANRSFIACCQDAVKDQEIVLFFDTFEKVQDLYAGKWFTEKFLPEVRDAIIVIAGRPEPQMAEMPDNIVVFPIAGLGRLDVERLVQKKIPNISVDALDRIFESTEGIPLLINLILDLPTEEIRYAYIGKLGKGVKVRERPDLREDLMGIFAEMRKPLNRVVWAMAYCKRRFDLKMLRFLIENSRHLNIDNYETVYRQLGEYVYIKHDAERETHLLHDEIQRMVCQSILDDVDHDHRMRNEWYDLLVNRYYPSLIDTAMDEKSPEYSIETINRYRAERLGYMFDQTPVEGMERYNQIRSEEIERSHNYDLEELLWGEIRQHLSALPVYGYDHCRRRGRWLLRNSLFQKGAEHYNFMLNLEYYEHYKTDLMQSHGFMLLRDGEIDDAIEIFEDSIELVTTNDYSMLATIENNLGQAKREKGLWDEAVKHFEGCWRYAKRAKSMELKVSGFLNRGELYSLQGNYETAKEQCKKALDLLSNLPLSDTNNIQRLIYASMYLGMAFRHSGDYVQAEKEFSVALKKAQDDQNQEAIGRILQQLGINAHLIGRKVRREDGYLDEACKQQLKAWQYLTEALDIATQASDHRRVAHGFNRLAKVYREINHLELRLQEVQNKQNDAISIMKDLTVEAKAWSSPFDGEYEQDWWVGKPFEELNNWQEKSLRLFSLSAWMAAESNAFHRALDSLIEVSRLLLDIGSVDDILSVLNQIDRMKGYDFQADLFSAMSQIVRGDLEYIFRKDYAEALAIYKDAYLHLAQQTGYAVYILRDRLRDLEWRIKYLPDGLAAQWCDSLHEYWSENDIGSLRPEMINMLEKLMDEYGE